MLPRIVHLNPGLPRRGRWCLVLLALAILALPTWHQQAHSQLSETKDSANKKADAQPDDTKPSKTKLDETKPTEVKPTDTKAPETKSGGVKAATPSSTSGVRSKAPTVSVKRPKLPAMAPPSVEYLPEPTDVEQGILEALEKVIKFDFVDATLHDVRNKLIEEAQINIVIASAKLAEESVTEDAANFNLTLQGVSLRSGLRILLNAKGLDFVIEDEVLKITTQTDAQTKQLTRTYPVRDLVGNVDADYQSLVIAIQNAVGGMELGSPWFDVDGEGGTISILPASGCLVIRHTRHIHDDIIKLLRAIRGANMETEVKENHAAIGVTH